jgi:ferric-dicitrate binding protein FerR (iron transport regulator)
MSAPDRETAVQQLIRLAGERDMPSPEATERARAAALESWQASLALQAGGTRRTTRWLPLAAAAGIALVAGSLYWFNTRTADPVLLVAHVSTVDDHAALRPGQKIYSASTLQTTSGRVALTFGDSLSLRLDRNTRLRFDSAEGVTLLDGSVYVDSGGVNAVTRLRIVTPAGEVRHVGTQFQVSVGGTLTHVQVREGRVVLTPADGRTQDIGAGDRLVIDGGNIDLQRGQPAFGAAWEWVAQTAPLFDMENRPLTEFLTWIAREHGWQVRYGDATLQARAQGIRLHGSLAGLDAPGMLERVALITGVPIVQIDGVVWVGKVEAR